MLADALLEVDFLRDTRRIRAAVAKLEARRTETATAAATAALARQAEVAAEVSDERERGRGLGVGVDLRTFRACGLPVEERAGAAGATGGIGAPAPRPRAVFFDPP
jgi:hypothetical protein